MRIYGIQLDIVWEDKEANFRKVETLLGQVRPEPGSLVVLPEMFATGFSMNLRQTQERRRSITEDRLEKWARQYDIFLIAGVVRTVIGGAATNEAVLFDPRGHLVGHFAKLHPFPLAKEGDFYRPGNEIVTWRIQNWVVAPFLCYDLRFPEVFRMAMRQGAIFYVILANWPASRMDHWRILLRARAIENQAYVLGVNRCGEDPNTRYAGGSMLVSPKGEVLMELGEGESILRAEIQPEGVQQYRQEFPVLPSTRFV